MRVILQGSVRHFAAAELMALLARNLHTGTFDADSGERRVRLFFREGRIAWGEGTSGNDAQAVMTDLVAWTDGNFTFLDAVSLPEGVTPLALDPIELAAEGARQNDENRKVLALYPDEQTFLRVVPQPQTDVISLKPEQFQILFTIGTGRSLAQLLTTLGRTALDLYPAVHALQTAGLIEPATAPEPAAPKPEPAAPPPPPPPPPPRAQEAAPPPPPPAPRPPEPINLSPVSQPPVAKASDAVTVLMPAVTPPEPVAPPPPPVAKASEPPPQPPVAKAPEEPPPPPPVAKAPEPPPPPPPVPPQAATPAAPAPEPAVPASEMVTRIEPIAAPPMAEHPFAKEPEPEPEDPDKTRVEPPPDPSTDANKGGKKKTTIRQRTMPIATLTSNEGMMFPLLEDESTIGRVRGNSVVIPDGSISSRHARVLRTADAFTIEDLGSRNGTFVNGDPIKESRSLKDNDMVRCGKVILTFNIAAVANAKEMTQPEVPLPRRKTKG